MTDPAIPDTNIPKAPAPLPSDIFSNMSQLYVQQQETDLTISAQQMNVPVGRPNANWFIRTYDGPEQMLVAAIYQDKEQFNDTYFITSGAVQAMAEAMLTLRRARLQLYQNSRRTLGIWTLILPGPDGRQSSWAESALHCADVCKTEWRRIVPNQDDGGYRLVPPFAPIAQPIWPDPLDLGGIYRAAFRGKLIDETRVADHPILRRARGEQVG